MIVDEVFSSLFGAKLLERVSPEDVAHQALGWCLSETINTLDVFESVQFRTQSTVDTQKLLVHDSSEWKCAEGLHACLVDVLGILVLTLKLESKVVRKMPALVVAAQKPQCVRIPYLQRP